LTCIISSNKILPREDNGKLKNNLSPRIAKKEGDRMILVKKKPEKIYHSIGLGIIIIIL